MLGALAGHAALTTTLSLSLAVGGMAGLAPAAHAPRPTSASAPPPEQRAVATAAALRVSTLASGLDHPWDVAQIGPGTFLVTERDRRTLSLVRHQRRHTVRFPSTKVWATFETGLMSVVTSADFATSRQFFTCSGWNTATGPQIQVRRWELSPNRRRALPRGKVLGGIPTFTGRHAGCRLLVDPRNGNLWVGTGDAAASGLARNLDSLAGKVLRLDARGRAHPRNPWAGASGARRYVWSYGHRNVQGLAQQPGTGKVWSVEHGPSTDDEINRSVRGGDFGWDPGPVGGYDESVPMTDPTLPGRQVEAAWSSGSPTLAPSGATWVRGRQWGPLRGTLAVAILKGERLVFFRQVGAAMVEVDHLDTAGTHGRLRTVHQATNGDLLVTTDNGDGADRILRLRPR